MYEYAICVQIIFTRGRYYKIRYAFACKLPLSQKLTVYTHVQIIIIRIVYKT
jgi:hypothetical protein